jgi:ribosomal protein L20
MNYIILLLFFSCSQITRIEHPEDTSREAPKGISIDEVFDSEIKSEDDAYEAEQLSVKKETPIFLQLNGKGTTTLAYIGVLKNWPKKKWKNLKAMSGTGWGSLIVALIAKYEKIDMVEWVLYKHLKNNFDSDIYENYRTLIEKEFAGLDEAQLKYPVFKKGEGVYQKLLLEFKNAEDQAKRGVYWQFTQACPNKKINYELWCLRIGEKEKIINNINRKEIILPLMTDKQTLVDLIDQGKRIDLK